MSWFVNNWDKLLGIFLTVILAGVIGFYSAILSMEKQLATLKTDFVGLKVEMDKSVSPKLNVIDNHSEKISLLEKTVMILTTENQHLKGQHEKLSQQTDSFLMLQIQKGSFPIQPIREP